MVHSGSDSALPTFVIIGAQKCGTTSIYALCADHPEIYMAPGKELHFFSHDDRYREGLGAYRALFEGGREYAVRGEASPSYTRASAYPEAAQRLAEAVPEAQLVYIVRDPFDRMRSAWQHYHHAGDTRAPLGEALRELPTIVDASCYWRQIQRYRRHFADDRIHPMFLEQFKRSPEAEAARLFRFLGVDPETWSTAEEADDTHKHPSAVKQPDSRLVSTIRRVPGFGALRDAMPRGLRRTLARTLKRPVPEADWTDDARAYALEQLGDDTARFLDWAGMPTDYYGAELAAAMSQTSATSGP